jgi:transposase
MYIRRTTIKSRGSAEPYYTYRLVESVRTVDGVRQRTLLNLGRHFDVPQDQWSALSQRIEELLSAQSPLMTVELSAELEATAQRLVARLLHRQAESGEAASTDIRTVDVDSLDLVRPRSVGVEHVLWETIRQLGLDAQLKRLGLNGPQLAAAIGSLVARAAAPGSERATEAWLKEHSALGELIDYDYTNMHAMALYRISDRLWRHKAALEGFLFERERDLFAFEEVITLYDLTNTYFEGTAKANPDAKRGKSKERRTDCPLVTLALVLDGSGFPKHSEIFPGNASEPQTLERMLTTLTGAERSARPTVVLDAGIASEDNVAWLVAHAWPYVVVSRRRERQFDPDAASIVQKRDGVCIRAERRLDPDTGEVHLYCHSSQREDKERGILELATQRFEAELAHLVAGLSKRGNSVKRYDKVLERIGRLRQKYPKAAPHYAIDVTSNPDSGKATAIAWRRITPVDDILPGVYCLRSDRTDWDEATLWRTYIMLTDLEAVFRCLKSELGLRPVYHQKRNRVAGHLFLSVLAYHLVHTIRFQLKAAEIDLSWKSIRERLATQQRVTAQLKDADGRTLHIRKCTRAEPSQLAIYDALGIPARPGRTEKTVT